MKKLFAIASLVIGNIVWFYAMKNYTDMRQVRIVSATCESTVQVAAIGPIIIRKPYVKFKGVKVVEVGYHYKREGFGQLNSASGVFVSNDGLILTCYHATHGKKLMEVSLNGFVADSLADKKVRKLFAYVVGVDEEADLALLKVIYPGQWFRGVHLRKEAEIGLPVFTIGFPDGFEKYVTAGILSNHADRMTYSDTVMDHGSSGGGVFDVDGDLVGLADAMHYPNLMPTYQGFSKFTNLKAMHGLINKYEGF